MINNMRVLYNNKTTKRLFSNFFSLVLLQGINYLAPLIMLPYLVRVLGIEKFGLWAFATAAISYFILLTDYGFEFTATKNISLHRNDTKKLQEIYNTVLTIKFLLALAGFSVLLLLTFFVDKFAQNAYLFYLLFGTVIGSVLFPVWFFQGIEKMKYITILNVISKIIFLTMIFIFVKKPDDIYLVALFSSLGFLAAGITAQYIIKRDYSLTFGFQKLSLIKEELIEGWYVFTTRITVNLYTTSNVIFLGFLTTDTITGYYSIAEKLVVAIGGMFIPLLQTLYPHFAKMYAVSKERFFKANKTLSLGIFFTAVVFVAFANIFDKEILLFITGKVPNEYLITLFQTLSIVVLVFPYGGQFTRMLITMNKARLLNRIVLIGAVLDLILAPLLIRFYSASGLAWLTVAIGFYIALVKGYFTYKNSL